MGEREIQRKPEEIDQLLNECQDKTNEGGSKFPGMTYEQGIVEAIEWLTNSDIENIYGE